MQASLTDPERRKRVEFNVGIALLLLGVVAVAALVVALALFPRGPSAPAASSGTGAVMRGSMPMQGMYSPAMVRPTAAKGELMVAVGDYWFKPSATRLRAGRYKMTVHNYGGVQHDVMIERMPIKWANNEPMDEAAPFGVDDTTPGKTMSSMMELTAGKWELFCSLPGHYASGQHAVITVYGHMKGKAMHGAPSGMGAGGMGSTTKSAM